MIFHLSVKVSCPHLPHHFWPLFTPSITPASFPNFSTTSTSKFSNFLALSLWCRGSSVCSPIPGPLIVNVPLAPCAHSAFFGDDQLFLWVIDHKQCFPHAPRPKVQHINTYSIWNCITGTICCIHFSLLPYTVNSSDSFFRPTVC